jgi:hypothetical protein
MYVQGWSGPLPTIEHLGPGQYKFTISGLGWETEEMTLPCVKQLGMI